MADLMWTEEFGRTETAKTLDNNGNELEYLTCNIDNVSITAYNVMKISIII